MNYRSLPLYLFAVIAFVLASCSQDVVTPQQESELSTMAVVQAAPAGAKKVPGQYVIVFKSSVVMRKDVPAETNRLEKAHGLTIGHVYDVALMGFSATVPAGVLKKLQQDNRIERIEEDYEISVNPIETDASKIFNRKSKSGSTRLAQSIPWGIAATGSRDGAGKVAWIIDTGIDPNHADLNVDGQRSANFVIGAREKSSTWQDKHGHGTHVAGTIAAKDDGFDVVGVASGAVVVAVRCLDARGSGQYSWIIAGVDHVAKLGRTGDVCNMSLGGPAYGALDDAVRTAANKGIMFAIAAGNSSTDCSNTSPARVALNQYNVWTVSAHDQGGRFAWFSNYGLPILYSAPGVDIVSTRMGGGVAVMSGTSMAAPHVAGILLVGTFRQSEIVNGDPDNTPDIMARLQ